MNHIVMEAINNFRDFGGYQTRNGTRLKTGLLYRSGDLSEATDADFEQIEALGIKTVCDLRSIEEQEKEPNRSPGKNLFTYFNIPMRPVIDYHGRSLRRLLSLMFGSERRMDYVAESHQAYREYATEYLPQIKALLRRISDPANLPLLLHCSAGKDRTGVVSSFIQMMLGVPEETARDDYLISNGNLDEYTQDKLRQLSKLGYFGIPWRRLYGPLFAARVDFFDAALDQMKKEFGAVDEWFKRGLGFSVNEQLALTAVLAESSA